MGHGTADSANGRDVVLKGKLAGESPHVTRYSTNLSPPPGLRRWAKARARESSKAVTFTSKEMLIATFKEADRNEYKQRGAQDDMVRFLKGVGAVILDPERSGVYVVDVQMLYRVCDACDARRPYPAATDEEVLAARLKIITAPEPAKLRLVDKGDPQEQSGIEDEETELNMSASDREVLHAHGQVLARLPFLAGVTLDFTVPILKDHGELNMLTDGELDAYNAELLKTMYILGDQMSAVANHQFALQAERERKAVEERQRQERLIVSRKLEEEAKRIEAEMRAEAEVAEASRRAAAEAEDRKNTAKKRLEEIQRQLANT